MRTFRDESRTPTIAQVAGGVALLVLAVILPIFMTAIGKFSLLVAISSSVLATVGYLLLDILMSAALELVVELIRSWRPWSHGLVGEEAEVRTEDRVLLKGAIWKAKSDAPLFAGDKVRIISVRGLTLKVKKAPARTDSPPDRSAQGPQGR